MPRATSHGLGIHYEDRGSGSPVVLLHSFLCSGAMWGPQLEPLAAGRRVINVDLRGHGESDPVRVPFDLDGMLDDVVAVLDHAGVERAAWAGLSVGGMVALRAALRHRDRVSALLLLDSDAGAERGRRRLEYRLLGVIARLLGVRPLRGRIAAQMFGASTLRERPALVDEWCDRFEAADLPSMLHVLDALIARETLFGQTGAIDVPALVLVGEEDASLPPALSRRLAEALPHATLEVIPGAGHLSALEQPEAVTRAMLGFLEREAPA